MKAIVTMILVYCLMVTSAFGQATNPSNTLKIGTAASASDKGLIFDTADGVSNKKLLVEKISKNLKYDGNTFQLGDGSGSSDKTLSINGASKSLKYNGTSGEFEFDDTLKLSSDLKTNTISPASGAETNFTSDARVQDQLFIGASNNQLRVSGGNLEFSNDGSLYKKIGSGSGSGGSGGVSVLTNDSFEDGVSTGWTSSGGTFSQQTFTNGVENDLKYARFVASAGAEYFESTAVATPTFMVGGCQVDFKNVNATTGQFKLEVIDGSANILATATIGTLAWSKQPALAFPCPTTPTTMKMRVTSLSAGTIEVDHAYLGSNQNLVYTSQARLLGTITWANTASCSWSVTNTAFTVYPADADCPTPTVTGELTAPATKIPGFILPKYLKGDYKIEAIGAFYTSTANSQIGFQFYDGTNASKGSNSAYAAATVTAIAVPYINGVISNAVDQASTTIQIRASSSSGAAVIDNENATKSLSISVWYYPQASEVAVSAEQSNWFIDVNIGGANPTVAGAPSSYTEITSASLDLVHNTGSATAQIACSTTNPSTGTTCAAGSESVGIAFVPAMPGRHKVCAYYSSNYGSGTAGTQLVQTPNNAQTILSEGGTRYLLTQSAGSVSDYFPQASCGYFNLTDTSKATIRLMAEVNSGTLTIQADRGALVGQPDIHFTVENLSFPQNRPILVGGQSTVPGIPNGRVDLLNYTYGDVAGSSSCTTGTCTMTQSGTGVTSTVWNSTGSYTTTYGRTYTKLFCTANVRIYGTSNGSVNPSGLTCSNCNTLTFLTTNNSDTASNTGGIFNCTGTY
jgi:hypothetical protein